MASKITLEIGPKLLSTYHFQKKEIFWNIFCVSQKFLRHVSIMARSTEESRTGFEQHEGESILHELSLVSDRQVKLQITCVFVIASSKQFTQVVMNHWRFDAMNQLTDSLESLHHEQLKSPLRWQRSQDLVMTRRGSPWCGSARPAGC